jgi:hypothetical protein
MIGAKRFQHGVFATATAMFNATAPEPWTAGDKRNAEIEASLLFDRTPIVNCGPCRFVAVILPIADELPSYVDNSGECEATTQIRPRGPRRALAPPDQRWAAPARNHGGAAPTVFGTPPGPLDRGSRQVL